MKSDLKVNVRICNDAEEKAKADDQPLVIASLEKIEVMLEGLDQHSNYLYKRLSNILSQSKADTDDREDEMEKNPHPAASPIAESILRMHRRIERMYNEQSRICDRLEI